MIEIDGPPMAWFEDSAGNKHVYTVYAYAKLGHTAAEVIQAYASWRAAYEDTSCVLVWRRRPTLKFEEDDIMSDANGLMTVNPNPKPRWKVTCRCVKVPIAVFGRTMREIKDGEPIIPDGDAK